MTMLLTTPADASLVDMIDALLDDAPSALVGPAWRVALGALGERLPAELTRGLYLECRLAAEASRVDLATCLERDARALFAAGSPRGAPLAALWDTEAWRPIRALCTEWSRPDGALHAHVERLWLEFDTELGDDATATPRPGVFLDLRPAFAELAPARQLDALCRALDALGAPPTVDERARLLAVLRQLPPGAFLFNLGLFPHRPHALRLCVAGVAASHVLPVLRATGWVGDEPGVDALVAELHAAMAHVQRGPTLLHADIERVPRGRVGIEYALRGQPQARGALHTHPLLALLAARGWCAADKRAALAAWPRRTVRRLESAWLPVTMTRLVNHLKLVWRDGDVAESKAYLFGRFVPQGGAAPGSTA